MKLTNDYLFNEPLKNGTGQLRSNKALYITRLRQAYSEKNLNQDIRTHSINRILLENEKVVKGKCALGHEPALRQPKNFAQRLVYALALLAPPCYAKQVAGIQRVAANAASASYWGASYPLKANVMPCVTYQGARVKRRAPTLPRFVRGDPEYAICKLLNKKMSATINSDNIDALQLVDVILISLITHPEITPDLARLTLYNSGLYGERQGERLTTLQQKGIIGQLSCRLIYQEESIALRMIKLFDGNRHMTQKEFQEVVQTWSYPQDTHTIKNLWRMQFEGPEIPVVYLMDLYNTPEGRNKNTTNNIDASLDLDNLIVGSLTWGLLQFGARSITLNNADELHTFSTHSLLERGLGLVAMFREGLLASGVEPVFYLGLMIYYMRARPELTINQILSSGSLDAAFAHFKTELEYRHAIAQRLYNKFSDYQMTYQKTSWRSREAAARELVKKYCGGLNTPVFRITSTIRAIATTESEIIRQIMLHPSSQICLVSGLSIPNLDEYYQEEVNHFAGIIRDLDIALMEAAFISSDIRDENIQAEDILFLEQATIKWVKPTLFQKRQTRDMFYSNIIIKSEHREDTQFFLAKNGNVEKLYVLQTTLQGYLLRKVPMNDPHHDSLSRYMVDWPSPSLVTQYELSIIPLRFNEIAKHENDTLLSFIRQHAEQNYHIYQHNLHGTGYGGTDSISITEKIYGYIIPFYSCIKSLNSGQHQAAYVECTVDGALVGLPLVFCGVKAGLGLLREASVGVAQSLSGPVYKATEQNIYRNMVPASVQIAGGITASKAEMRHFMDIMGKGAMKSIDPGFAAVQSFGHFANGIYAAAAGRSLLGLGAMPAQLIKVSGEIPKIISENIDLDIRISYDAKDITPLTLMVKGIDYSLLKVEGEYITAAATGERRPDGQVLYAQLDIQNQYGIYVKYSCLYFGNGRCQLIPYKPAEFELTLSHNSESTSNNPLFWLINSSIPIHLAVVYPLHVLEFSDRQWTIFEINHRRWAFEYDTNNIIPADNVEDWTIVSNRMGGMLSLIERSEDDRSFGLKLTPVDIRRKRQVGMPKMQDWGDFLVNYTLNDERADSQLAAVHNGNMLRVKIGENDFLLTPEKNAGTFLLNHPTDSNSPSFRVAYIADSGDFVFASPIEFSYSHHIGERLRHYFSEYPKATREPYVNYLLPPLLNGALKYGNAMFLKLGDRILPIIPEGDFYQSLPWTDDNRFERRWTLRYELFTGTFDIVNIPDNPTKLYQGKQDMRSRFEKLAAQIYSQDTYATLAILCVMDNPSPDSSPAPVSDVYMRLRQTALLLRLDRWRRLELLHASSVSLRSFSVTAVLPQEWIVDYPAMSLWASLEKTVVLSLADETVRFNWTSRELTRLGNIFWRKNAPILFVMDPNTQLFISHIDQDANGVRLRQDFKIEVLPDGLNAMPVLIKNNMREWLPNINIYLHSTLVTKFRLSTTQQPVFLIDNESQIWAKTPDGVSTRLYRNNPQQKIDDIVTSPDGSVVALIHLITSSMADVKIYHMPRMGDQGGNEDLLHTGEYTFQGISTSVRASWVTDTGEMFVPLEDNWSYLTEKNARWAPPEGYKPNFVSPDQRFLGYVRREMDTLGDEVMLIDTHSDKLLLLTRSFPVSTASFGMGSLVSVAFSAVNALIAISFSDGYIEIYRIHDEENSGKVVSLGNVTLPLANMIIDNLPHAKPKQIAMQFNNAFNRLIVFHDVGDLTFDLHTNCTYAASEVFLQQLN